jgi:hypothetical protein
MKKTLTLTVALLICISLSGEFSFFTPSPNFDPGFQLGGFLHPDNMKMNHSMSFSSGVSSTGHGFYQSAYTNHLRFDLRDNLRLNIDTSVINMGSMTHENNLRFSDNKDNHNVIVPAFSVQYKPTENSTIYFEYRQYRGIDAMRHSRNPHHEWWK